MSIILPTGALSPTLSPLRPLPSRRFSRLPGPPLMSFLLVAPPTAPLYVSIGCHPPEAEIRNPSL